jgi:anti-sigma factor RsiW
MTGVTPPVPPSSGPVPPDDGDRSLLSAYLDGELTDEERTFVEARLRDSGGWRAELDEVRAARDALRGLDPRVAPEGFWDRVVGVVASAPLDVATPGSVDVDVDVARDAGPPIDAGSGGDAARVVSLDEQRDRRRPRRRVVAWVAGGVAAAVVFGAMFVIPGRHQVRPDVAAVVTHHGATSAERGDPVSGLVPLAPMRRSR